MEQVFLPCTWNNTTLKCVQHSSLRAWICPGKDSEHVLVRQENNCVEISPASIRIHTMSMDMPLWKTVSRVSYPLMLKTLSLVLIILPLWAYELVGTFCFFSISCTSSVSSVSGCQLPRLSSSWPLVNYAQF